LSDDIVWLALTLLGSFDCGGFVDVPLIVDVELSKGVSEAEDVALLELRVLPGWRIRFCCA